MAQYPDGIGRFRVGKTTIKIIDSLSSEKQILVKKVNSGMQQAKALSSGWEYFIENVSNEEDGISSPVESSKCSLIRSFVLSDYDFHGIKLKEIWFVFFRDTLSDLKFEYNSDLKEAIDAKYGKAREKFQIDTSTCSTVGKLKLINYEWITPKYLYASAALGERYAPYNCKPYSVSGIYFSNLSVQDVKRECERLNKNVEEKHKNKVPNKVLDDL